jgi:hypothetical protein
MSARTFFVDHTRTVTTRYAVEAETEAEALDLWRCGPVDYEPVEEWSEGDDATAWWDH